jgi:hypothetical protein
MPLHDWLTAIRVGDPLALLFPGVGVAMGGHPSWLNQADWVLLDRGVIPGLALNHAGLRTAAKGAVVSELGVRARERV